MRAAGVPGRGENGKTCSCVSPHSSTRSSERANIASVSVGKPAMMSAPNTTSGRSRRTCSQNAIASRARMPPLHALEDEIVAGLQRQMQMRHQPRLVAPAHRADRRRPPPNRSRTAAAARVRARPCRMRLTSAPSRSAASRAVAGDIDAGEHDFAIAVRDQAARLRHAPRPPAASANCRARTE